MSDSFFKKEVYISLDCENFEAKLSQYLEDELNPWEVRIATNHLINCVECTQTLEGVCQVRTLLGNLSSLNPPSKFDLGLACYLEQQLESRRATWHRIVGLGLALTAALAIVFCPDPEFQMGSQVRQEVFRTYSLAEPLPSIGSTLIASIGPTSSYSPAYVQLIAFQQESIPASFSK